MKIKFCSIFLLICLLLGALCACGSTKSESPTKLSSVYNVKWTPDAPANTLTNISELNTSLNTESDGTLALFAKEENGNKVFNVYSLETQTVVYTKTVALTSADSVSLACGQIIDLSSDKYFLYDKTGKKITEGNGAIDFSTKANLVILDNTVYRINDYTYAIEDSFTYSSISGELPEFTYWNDNYYYLEVEKDLFVYNNKCELLHVYTVPAGAYEYGFFYLYDGSVMIQYSMALPDDAVKYDILSKSGEKKYDLHTLVLDPKDGDTKEYEVSWLVGNVIAVDDENIRLDYLDDSVKNIAYVNTINDYRVDTNIQVYSIDSKCNVKGSLSNQLAGQKSMLIPFGNEKYLGESRNGNVYLLDKNGKNLGAINNYKGYNTHYLATETAVYDFSLAKVLDMDDMKYSDATSELIFFTNDDGKCTAVKSDGTTITVADGNNTLFAGVIAGDIYAISRPSEGTYSYYDASGNLLVSGISGELIFISRYDNCYLFSCLSTKDITNYYVAYTK